MTAEKKHEKHLGRRALEIGAIVGGFFLNPGVGLLAIGISAYFELKKPVNNFFYGIVRSGTAE